MADNCTEGHRKKAKYLLDDEELGLYYRILVCLLDLKYSVQKP